jgi:hypothetical protein
MLVTCAFGDSSSLGAQPSHELSTSMTFPRKLDSSELQAGHQEPATSLALPLRRRRIAGQRLLFFAVHDRAHIDSPQTVAGAGRAAEEQISGARRS